MSKTEVNQLRTLLYRVEASLGTPIFRSVFATVDGEEKDLTRNGQASCAVFVSGLLVWAEKLKRMSATVRSLEEELKENGWLETNDKLPAAVVIWEATKQADGELHEHTGFILNEVEAVSHSDKELSPVRHHVTYGETDDGKPVRAIKCIYRHPDLY